MSECGLCKRIHIPLHVKFEKETIYYFSYAVYIDQSANTCSWVQQRIGMCLNLIVEMQHP